MKEVTMKIGKTYEVIKEFCGWWKEEDEFYPSGAAINLFKGIQFKILKEIGEFHFVANLLTGSFFRPISQARNTEILIAKTVPSDRVKELN